MEGEKQARICFKSSIPQIKHLKIVTIEVILFTFPFIMQNNGALLMLRWRAVPHGTFIATAWLLPQALHSDAVWCAILQTTLLYHLAYHLPFTSATLLLLELNVTNVVIPHYQEMLINHHLNVFYECVNSDDAFFRRKHRSLEELSNFLNKGQGDNISRQGENIPKGLLSPAHWCVNFCYNCLYS